MMKFVLILAPGILAYIMCRIKKEYRMQITAAFIVYVILMNVAYNYKTAGNFVRFIRPVNQLIYQEKYKDTGEFPDAIIQHLINDRTVYTKDDRFSIEEAEEKGYNWLYAYYHVTNPVSYLSHYGAEVVQDANLNDNIINDQARTEDFEDIGYANDMMRNVCMYYPDDEELANYFFHYWYFSENVGAMHIYINYDGLKDANEIVFLWQNQEGGSETEDFYIMTKDYYDRNIKSDN